MKFFITYFFYNFFSYQTFPQNSWIRINQLGYLEHSIKNAVFVSKENMK
jgi:endoglucanase